MEIIRLVIDSAIEKNLMSKEWRKVESEPGSPYLGIPGGGVRAVYQRVWWPTLVRILLFYSLPFLLIAALMALVYFMNDLMAGAGFSDQYLFPIQLFFLAVILILLFYIGKPIVATWPASTPRSVAVLSLGLAWQEAGSLRYWSWEQLKAVRMVGYYLVIENKSGQAMRFHTGLYDTEFGRQAWKVCSQL